MTRKIEGRGAFIDGDGGRGTSLEAAPQREVEVTVYDKVLDEMRVFRCDLHLLETSMAYFSPIIRRYLGEEEEKERAKKASVDGAEVGDDAVAAGISSVASGKGGSGTVKSQEEGGSSKCKRPVVRSPIPLRVNCDMGIFAWLMSYVEGKQRPFTPENAVSIALSSNFLLMTQLVDLPLQYIKDHLVQVMLSGVNMECLTGELLARLSSMLSEGDLARAFLKLFEWRVEDSPNRRFLTALLRHMVCDRFGQGRAIGLRWCRYCGVLFDEQELKRLQRSGKSVRPVICPRLTKNSIGTRGEILTTHVSSQHPVDLAFPSLSWSDEHVERWAWRIIGATCFFLCRRCNHHVMLIDTVDHGCHGGMTNFVFVDGCSRSDAEALLAWYEVAKDLYVGGLSSMHSHQTDVPRECILALSPTGEWICDDGSERGVPGLWCTHPIAVARSVDAKGKVSLDSQNGFERWLVMELQQVMEEFGDLGRPGALEGNTRTPTPPPHSMSPVGGVGTSALPLHFGARNRGESLNGSGSTRPPFRGGRSDGRAGIANGNDTAGRRKEAPSSGMQQRARAVAGCARGAAYEHNRNGIASPSTQSVRVQEAHAPKLSMQNLLSLSSVLGKRNPTLQQATQ
ncbi:DUF3342 domain containing protein [Trypanosoma grayi]|uniref:DUF3342 domain containing protein n=1 Tax=Trypanosoma grayi TaxID=71804 RepID=UPI0004F42324|nr:DUF3342 domain containing protein [Trypanosoma grayi]KEG15339.1 DUF3342 domain containing protein [Trypanosoma grayi]